MRKEVEQWIKTAESDFRTAEHDVKGGYYAAAAFWCQQAVEKVRKRYLSVPMAHNLGRIMRSLIGAGKPRYLALLAERLYLTYFALRLVNKISQRLMRRMRMPGHAILPSPCSAV